MTSRTQVVDVSVLKEEKGTYSNSKYVKRLTERQLKLDREEREVVVRL